MYILNLKLFLFSLILQLIQHFKVILHNRYYDEYNAISTKKGLYNMTNNISQQLQYIRKLRDILNKKYEGRFGSNTPVMIAKSSIEEINKKLEDLKEKESNNINEIINDFSNLIK